MWLELLENVRNPKPEAAVTIQSEGQKLSGTSEQANSLSCSHDGYYSR
jgi:hypothetical protein